MSSNTPRETITLREAYSKFRKWLEQDLPALEAYRAASHLTLDAESHALDRYLKARTRAEQARKPAWRQAWSQCADRKLIAQNDAARRAEETRKPAREWWVEEVRRNLAAAMAFKTHLEAGALEIVAFDGQREFRITPLQWLGHQLTFSGRLSPFRVESISVPIDEPLARYNGLTPYVYRAEFDEWFAALTFEHGAEAAREIDSKPFQEASFKRGPGARPRKLEAAKTALRERYPNGVAPPALSNLAVSTQIQADLKAKGSPTASHRTIDKARHELASSQK